ncbi:MAG TPA: methylated-DNA--[protein]-cysteine S-methyltransferase [Clostridiaceae bacterium]|nr:methylated-DNA--[protein]-cysteine S-methyltransferase [Clostridiaceae bacterium]
MKKIFYYHKSVGKIGIGEENGVITDVFFGDYSMPDTVTIQETAIIKEASQQLDEYLEGRRKRFDLPVFAKGTPFQLLVWEALKTIPYGETRSYKDIAIQIGKAKACRAVGMANNRNPLSIVIPCHRVIGSKGELVGYGGGLDIKKQLLCLEGKKIMGKKVIL